MKQNLKKVKSLFLKCMIFCLVMMFIVPMPSFAQNHKLYVGGDIIDDGQSSYEHSGKVWVDVAPLVLKFGDKYFVNKLKTKCTIISKNGEARSYYIGQSKVFYNEKKSENIDFTPTLKNGRIMMPLDYVLKSYNVAYKWDKKNSEIFIFDVDKLIMGVLLENKTIGDEYYYVSKWDYVEGDFINYEIRKNTKAGEQSETLGTFVYTLSTGDLHKIPLKTKDRQYLGKYPVNINTAKNYKPSDFEKLSLFHDEDKVYVKILLSDVIYQRLENNMKKEKLYPKDMTMQERASIMYHLIQMESYGEVKAGLVLPSDENSNIRADFNKTNELSTLILDGPAKFDKFPKSKNGNLVWLDGISYPKAMIKYRKIEGDKVILKGELIQKDPKNDMYKFTVSFTVQLRKNSKSPLDGYVLDYIDYVAKDRALDKELDFLNKK